MQLSAGSYATAGLRGEDQMEDRHVIVEHLGGDAATTLLAVFDGHRGAAAADFAAHSLVSSLRRHWVTADPAETLRRSFTSLDVEFRAAEDATYAARVQQVGADRAGCYRSS